MRFNPITREQREVMLDAVGVARVDDLFAAIPPSARLGRPLGLGAPLSEQEVAGRVGALAAANRPAAELVSFLGAGCYDHYVPAIVDHVVRRPELFTAYTPYQPEVSQGTLQAIYEYQTMICELTGMDVSNASMYDGATALVEAAYLAAGETGRSRVVVSETVHPEWRETLRTYAMAGLLDIVEVPCRDGRSDAAAIGAAAPGAAAILCADPGFYGCFDDVAALRSIADETGALLVVASNPVLLGALEPPGSLGADVVVGEGQPLGGSMSFGGPGFGFFATRDAYLRRLPGRIVGRGRDVDGATAFVLTMQTREQHIRRERATSNICSNHSLNALAACVYLAAVGPEGLKRIATTCIAKAHYLREALLATGRFSVPWDAPFGHEFALAFDGDVAGMQRTLLAQGYLAGVDLGRFSARDRGTVLLAVTERRTRAEIDSFVEAVASS